jgi:hypothetical protein
MCGWSRTSIYLLAVLSCLVNKDLRLIISSHYSRWAGLRITWMSLAERVSLDSSTNGMVGCALHAETYENLSWQLPFYPSYF